MIGIYSVNTVLETGVSPLHYQHCLSFYSQYYNNYHQGSLVVLKCSSYCPTICVCMWPCWRALCVVCFTHAEGSKQLLAFTMIP